MAMVWRRLHHYNGMERKDKELMDLINNFFLSPSFFISAPLPPSSTSSSYTGEDSVVLF